MCGIVGLVNSKKQVDEQLLYKMCNVIKHRGTDDSGIFISPDRKVGFGHQRLSIIDLTQAGHQPMEDKEGRLWITYNGEVYNFKEIKKELETRGYKFKSSSDTEVIINAYKEWGSKCVQKFNGMFAFGIYDSMRRCLFLARDRVGKKPLYYTQYNGKFVFASELKAILCDAEFPKEIDYRALNFYLTFGYIPLDFTIFKHVRKLSPAHIMVYNIEKDEYEISRYWEIPLPDGKYHSEEELLEELEYLLEDAVRLRLISDVPVGAFLSGGVDSSLVVAMMSRVSDDPVKSFSIGFEENKYNELSYARIVSEYFRTEHTELIVKSDAFSILKELVKHFDEPFADSSMIPQYYLSKMTRKYVKVSLSGDGGDELFGGYSSYFGTLCNYYIATALPLFLRESMSKYAEFLSDKLSIKKQLLRLRYNPYRAFIDRMSQNYFKDGFRNKILNPEITNILGNQYNEPELIMYGILSKVKMDFINTLGVADFLTYLPDDICAKVDRTSMKVSLEVRCPLLDFRIAEFSFKKIRGNLKIRGSQTKYLLKKLARRILPQKLNLERKQGFDLPISEWFNGDLSPYVREILLDGKTCFFNCDYIEQLLKEHKAGYNHSGRLFTLLVFLLWEKAYYTEKL